VKRHEETCEYALVACPNSTAEICGLHRRRSLQKHIDSCQNVPCPHHSEGYTKNVHFINSVLSMVQQWLKFIWETFCELELVSCIVCTKWLLVWYFCCAQLTLACFSLVDVHQLRQQSLQCCWTLYLKQYVNRPHTANIVIQSLNIFVICTPVVTHILCTVWTPVIVL